MTTQTETKTKFPTHAVYYMKNKEGSDQAGWIKIGASWEHGDKEGMNLSLNIIVQNVSVIIRRNKSKAS